MKNKILLIILLLFPAIVFAEKEITDEETSITQEMSYTPETFSTMLPDVRKGDSFWIADDYSYEDGVYKLKGNVVQTKVENYPYDQDAEQPVVYMCQPYQGYSTECPILYVVFPKVEYRDKKAVNQPSLRDYYLALTYLNGEEYKEGEEYIYISEEYEQLENGKYKLINPERIYMFEFKDKVDMYTCANLYEKECDELYQVKKEEGRIVFVDDFENRILYGTTYTYKDGKYILQNTSLINPVYFTMQDNVYTCLTKEETCETLYKALAYEEFEIQLYGFGVGYGASTINYQVFTPSTETEEVKLDIKETKKVTGIQTSDRIVIEDESVLSVSLEAGVATIEPKKVGTTKVIIISREDKLRIINVIVSSIPEEPVNPNTKDLILVIVGLSLICLIIVIVEHKKIKYINQ